MIPAAQPLPSAPEDRRALVAVDLGAESCRVSLLRWREDGEPHIHLVHRFPNAAQLRADGLRWHLNAILDGVEGGLRLCAAIAKEGIRSIAVDGWAVDYVRLDRNGQPLADPYCYRDDRTIEAERSLHALITPQRMREITGVQLQKLNTVYQQHADVLSGEELPHLWLNLPEYLLHLWGGKAVSELSNATHTQMLDGATNLWSPEIFAAAGISLDAAPPLVPPGTDVGKLNGPLAALPAFCNTRLIAPCCHDTASAIAGIPASGDDWAYISSGTWSLVGTLLDAPCNSRESAAENFTNLAAAGGTICFHKSVNGMWLLRQCMEAWAVEEGVWNVVDLIAAARREPSFPETELIEVDDPDLLLPGRMPQRINEQRHRRGLAPLSTHSDFAPATARLIFQSLASRYAQVLSRIASLTRKRIDRIYMVGGGSQNQLVNELTAQATGIAVHCGSPESSTLGNFAVQLATQEGGATASRVAAWSQLLSRPPN